MFDTGFDQEKQQLSISFIDGSFLEKLRYFSLIKSGQTHNFVHRYVLTTKNNITLRVTLELLKKISSNLEEGFGAKYMIMKLEDKLLWIAEAKV